MKKHPLNNHHPKILAGIAWAVPKFAKDDVRWDSLVSKYLNAPSDREKIILNKGEQRKN